MSDELPPPLEYASPREDQLSPGRMVLQAVLACGVTCGMLMGAVVFAILFAFASNGSAGFVALAIATGVALLAGVVTLAVRLRRHPMRRGWAMGIWIGLGLAGLLEGLCFGGMMF